MLTESSVVYDKKELRTMAVNGWNVLPPNTIPDVQLDPILDKMYDGYTGPSEEVEAVGIGEINLFYFFLPKSFWLHVASESNRYWSQTLEDRVETAYTNQASAHERPREKIKARLSKAKPILPHELIRWLGLLVARMLNPSKHLEMHWSKGSIGVLPPGMFGSVMSRDRFKFISAFLHLSDNKSERARIDRAWKVRPILQTIESTFANGFILGKHIAIDEAMLPSTNRRNPTRQYLKNKPHKWGSKCVMVCCADTGYCQRQVLS